MSFVTPHNYLHIQQFVNCIHSSHANFHSVPDPLGPEDDVVIATSDRYGISINTVFNKNTGLLRSNPYYSPEALELFYGNFYRDIYSTTHPDANCPKSSLLALQVQTGIRILNKARRLLPAIAHVLDYGGGIGGALLPFDESGHRTMCVDYGDDYIEYGKRFGINGIVGGTGVIPEDLQFDLIILSHVLEHTLNPVDLISQLCKKLAPNGLIFIDVPGLDWIHTVWKHNFQSHLQNAHVWYFSRSTLTNILLKSGITSVKWVGRTSCFCTPGVRSDFELLKPLQHLSLTRLNHYLFVNRLFATLPSIFTKLSCKVVTKLFPHI